MRFYSAIKLKISLTSHALSAREYPCIIEEQQKSLRFQQRTLILNHLQRMATGVYYG